MSYPSDKFSILNKNRGELRFNEPQKLVRRDYAEA